MASLGSNEPRKFGNVSLNGDKESLSWRRGDWLEVLGGSSGGGVGVRGGIGIGRLDAMFE